MRRLLVSAGTYCLLWVVTTVSVANAQVIQPAEAIPDSASLVARWKTPQATLGKLADFVDGVQPGFGAVVRSNLPEVGNLIGNPGLKGVDVDQDFWMVMFAESGEEPHLVFILTAKDVDAVKSALAEDYEVHTAGKLVAYSEHEESLAKVRTRMNGEGKALSSKVDAASKTLFEASDLSILVNVKQLATDFADELAQAEPQLDAMIEQITNAIPDEQHAQMEMAFNIYRQLGKWALIGVRDTNTLTSGVTFTKTAIQYEDRLQVVDGTETSRFLARQQAGDLTLVSRLPANKSVYVGFKFDLSGMMQWSMALSKNLLMKDAKPEQTAQFDEAVKQMSQLKYDEMAIYFDLDGKSPAMRSGGVSVITPTNVIREISRKMQNSLADIHAPGFSQKTTLETNAEKIAGNDVDRVTIKQEFEDSSDPLGVQKKIQTTLFGTEGMQQLFMYQPTRTLQTMGGGSSEMQSLATALDSAKPTESVVATARQRFPAKANLVALTDLPKLAVSGLRLVAEQKLFPINVAALERLKFTPSFIGYGLAIEPTAVRTQLNIPIEQVQSIVKIVFAVQSPQ